MEQSATSVENIIQEKPRKRFTYHDNSLSDYPVIFETFAEGILQADGKFMKEKGIDPMQQSNIGCVVEDVLEIGRQEFEKFQKDYLEKEGITLAEYGEQLEEGVYQAYCEELGLTESMLAGKKVLDIGSAESFFASYCLKHGINDAVYSVDGGESSYIDQQVKKVIWSGEVKDGIEGKTKQALMQKLPYEEGSFDLVIILAALPGRDKEFRGELTLEQDVDQSYDEILRVLASGGEARIASFSGDENDEYFGEWYKATKRKLQELSQREGITVIFEDIPDHEGQRIILRKNGEAALKKLEQSRLFVDTIADAEGKPIDPGIKETIAVLNAYDIPTTQSCEGHSDQKDGRPYPWIRVGCDGEPAERYVGEAEAFQQTASEHGVPVEDLKRGDPSELYWEVIKKVSEHDETDEFKKWSSRNGEVLERVRSLLDEFYQGRETDEDVKLIIEEGAGGEFELRSHEVQNNEIIFGEISSQDFSRIVQKLHRRQVEMMEFTNFIKTKLLNKSGK